MAARGSGRVDLRALGVGRDWRSGCKRCTRCDSCESYCALYCGWAGDPGIALRSRGRLREDPLTLPWCQRFEIDLEQVEAQGAALGTCGGLRVNFYPGARVAEPPAGLRAGDRVEVLVKARPPRDYLDPGAFDVKAFLAREKIDVLGSLRSGELLQLVDRPHPTISPRFARE
jgi:hypothetical protein